MWRGPRRRGRERGRGERDTPRRDTHAQYVTERPKPEPSGGGCGRAFPPPPSSPQPQVLDGRSGVVMVIKAVGRYSLALLLLAATPPKPGTAHSSTDFVYKCDCAWLGSVAASNKRKKQKHRSIFLLPCIGLRLSYPIRPFGIVVPSFKELLENH